MMQKNVHFRHAFTMLELIFTIVILGIVSSISAEIIAKVYENYIIQRAHARASMKTELAALQIANRLRYAIPGTVYRIKNDDTLEILESALTGNGDDYKGFQWVGYAGDSFEAVTSSADRSSGWSGFIDLDDPSTDISNLKTPASNLNLTNTIIGNLSPGGYSIANAYVYFPNHTYYPVASVANDVITLNDVNSKVLYEQYKLAWSSYALVVENNGDLNLYYDFPAVPATARGATKELLLKGVKTFKFKGAGRTIRFKICVDEEIGEDFNITSCKEKAVF